MNTTQSHISQKAAVKEKRGRGKTFRALDFTFISTG